MAFPSFQQYIDVTTDSKDIAYETVRISHDQFGNIQQLVGTAAFDESIKHRLINLRDETLCDIYHISATTWGYLTKIEAETLEDFCSQVLKLQHKVLRY